MRLVFAVVVTFITGCQDCDNSKNPVDAPSGDVGTCTTNARCSPDQVCINGKCELPGSVMVGGACSATRDCMAGLNCSELGTCAPAGMGGAGTSCSTAADCMAGLACVHDGFGGTCAMGGTGDLGASCTATSDCIAGLACGNMDTCEPIKTAYPPFAGVMCEPDQSTFGAFYEVPRNAMALADFYRLPYPNDIRVDAAGKLDLSSFPRPGKSLLGVDVVDIYADALSEDFEGFSSVAPVTFRFTSELMFETLGPNGVNIQMIDVTPAAPQFGSGLGRAWSYTTGRGKFICQHALTLSNDRNTPLLPGHTYAAYLTTGIRSKKGDMPLVSADLTAVLGATPPTDPDLLAAWNKHAGFRQYLTQFSINPSTVAAVAVYTVADSSARARQLAAVVAGGALPALNDLTLCDGVNVSPCAGDGDRACGNSSGSFWEIHGKLTEPNFQAGTLPYATPADGGAITYTGMVPNTQGTQPVCFALTIPKTAAPGTGWPLVVHAHGTGGSFKAAITGGIADTIATASTPMATLTFDGIVHGARRNGSTRSVDSLVFNVINPRAARDNHLQGAVDVIQALRVAQVAPFTVGTVNVDFDPSKTYFFGHSQGSNVGILALAVTDVAQGAVLSGAGSDLTLGILTKTSPVDARAGLQLVLGEPISSGHPVMVIWQTFFDRIDPVNFSPMLVSRPPTGVASKHVMQTWSATDTFSPKDTLTATARTGRFFQADPTVIEVIGTADPRPITPNRVAGDGLVRFATVFQYATDGTYDGHFVAQRNATAIADWRAFLVSLAAGAPSVP